MGKFVTSAKELEVYQMAYGQAMELFKLSSKFPPEERYAPTYVKPGRNVAIKLIS